ncbi:putative phosphate butyryltransferase [Brochothrix thermosphacta]|uniref:Phosphotransacetylase n=4 Tax=Listeriaceae TaxID=186820 RepID=A0A291BVQ7_BROTH|nr:phosphotransacetylase [Brochothrix thermosphacta]ATH84637.1 phosphotransacetylase [Brochothrix thermosphacta]MPQ27687.1 phosphotransacetylase [Brochothrix thermosphacta]SPN72335.1 putative phosphate butyryltransferase [Brochothrix thermosphacta]SPN76781.1 putative phosphate butyryltransferase [Brochothrix thermosphacta]
MSGVMATRTVAIAGADAYIIDAFVKPAAEKNICHFIIFGCEDIDVSDITGCQYTKCETIDETVSGAVQAVQAKKAQIIMKGNIHTSMLLSAILKRENNLRDKKVLSQVSVINFKDGSRQWVMSDPGLNIAPDVATKIEISKNAIDVAKNIGITCPKVALLSAVETVSPKMQSSVDAKAVADYFAENPYDAIVEGPISMDIATDAHSAVAKKYPGEIQGDADVLIVPNIESGNLMYKTITHFIPSVISGAIIGAKVPVVLTSRSDSLDSKLASLELAIQNVVD